MDELQATVAGALWDLACAGPANRDAMREAGARWDAGTSLSTTYASSTGFAWGVQRRLAPLRHCAAGAGQLLSPSTVDLTGADGGFLALL